MNAFFATPAMLLLDVLMIVYSLWVLGQRNSLSNKAWWIGSALLGWLALLYIGFATQSVFPANISGWAFYLVVLAGVGCVGSILLLPRAIRDYVLQLDQRQLMMLQGVRVYFGACFLIQGGLGLLPNSFAVIDGLTHISAGFFSLIAAFCVAAGRNGRRRVWFANVFGLTDILIVATSLAFVLLDDIGPYHPMMYAVFLPAPIWLWAHLISIYKLLDRKADNQLEFT